MKIDLKATNYGKTDFKGTIKNSKFFKISMILIIIELLVVIAMLTLIYLTLIGATVWIN